MMSKVAFFDRLDASVKERGSLLCIGLDPHPGMSIQEAHALCHGIISETSDFAAAYKPNSAFFEQFGGEGFSVLKEVINSIPKDIPVILDCKRGDIENTAEAYARAAYVACGADAVTLSPYMGYDSVRPFTTEDFSDKAAFILCKTSNPTSEEIQGIDVLGDGGALCPLFEQVARLCLQWPHPNTLGLVVGATDVPALRRVRAIAPDTWILCPGVGAQGGVLEDVCDAGLRANGGGLLVSVSRGIVSQAALGHGAMAAEARRLRDEINALRTAKLSYSGVAVTAHPSEPPVALLKDYQRQFLAFAAARGALQFGSFALKSGRVSPYFFNAGAFSTGACLNALGRFYAQAIRDSGIQFDVLFGPAYKGIALASAAAMWWPQLGYCCGESGDVGGDVEVAYNRKEAKDHGEGGQLVGTAVVGRRVLIVDDVITAGTAVREIVRLLRQAGAVVVGVAVCLDRQERVAEDSEVSAVQAVEREFGFPVISIVGLNHLVEYLRGQGDGNDAAHHSEVAAYRARYGV